LLGATSIKSRKDSRVAAVLSRALQSPDDWRIHHKHMPIAKLHKDLNSEAKHTYAASPCSCLLIPVNFKTYPTKAELMQSSSTTHAQLWRLGLNLGLLATSLQLVLSIGNQTLISRIGDYLASASEQASRSTGSKRVEMRRHKIHAHDICMSSAAIEAELEFHQDFNSTGPQPYCIGLSRQVQVCKSTTGALWRNGTRHHKPALGTYRLCLVTSSLVTRNQGSWLYSTLMISTSSHVRRMLQYIKSWYLCHLIVLHLSQKLCSAIRYH
jgi:hypothetical protein